jgi:hypothetical protein
VGTAVPIEMPMIAIAGHRRQMASAAGSLRVFDGPRAAS